MYAQKFELGKVNGCKVIRPQMLDFRIEGRFQNFGEIAGQEHAIGLIKQMLIKKRLSKGIMFRGEYGVGKTAFAYLIAKALFCLNRQDSPDHPCGICSFCKWFQHEEGGVRPFGLYEVNCSQVTALETYKDILTTVDLYHPFSDCALWIVILDEFRRTTGQIKDLFLPALERNSKVLYLFTVALNGSEKIEYSIYQRVTTIELYRPSHAEIEEWLKKITPRLGLTITDNKVFHLISEYSCVPRECLGLLEKISILGCPVTEENIKKIIEGR